MRLRILGKNSDDKGTQLERLARRLLERLGYANIALNVIGAGANELDILAEFPVPGLQSPQPMRLVGECKAHESPISLPDWLKFLGKVYTEEARHPGQVRGILIALSGANGNVVGAVEAFMEHRTTVDLIAGERLAELAIQHFGIPSAAQVASEIQGLTATPTTEMSLGYYDNELFWVLEFAGSSFTILRGSDLRGIASDETVSLVSSQLAAPTYRNLLEEEKARSAIAFARKHVLARLLVSPGHSSARAELPQAIAATEAVATELEIAAAVEALRVDGLVTVTPDHVSIARIQDDIELRLRTLQEMTDGFVLQTVLGTEAWMSLIDDMLMAKILAIQGALPMPTEIQKESIQLMRWSPSALAWALRPDPMIANHRSHGPPPNPDFDKNDVRYFQVQMMRNSVGDFQNGQLSSMFLERLGLRELTFFRRAEFKSSEKVELSVTVTERHGIARAAPDLGGGIVRVWLHEQAPDPWEWAVKGSEEEPHAEKDTQLTAPTDATQSER